MKTKPRKWTKEEFQIYVLLLCANADSDASKDEINLIKSKVTSNSYERMYKEFNQDSEDERIEKVDDNIQLLEFSNIEMAQLRREMYEVFFSDCDFKMMERNLDRIFDNILY